MGGKGELICDETGYVASIDFQCKVSIVCPASCIRYIKAKGVLDMCFHSFCHSSDLFYLTFLSPLQPFVGGTRNRIVGELR